MNTNKENKSNKKMKNVVLKGKPLQPKLSRLDMKGVVLQSSAPPCLYVQVHSAEQSSGEAEPRAEGGAGDEPLSESQSGAAAGPAGGGGAQRKRER